MTINVALGLNNKVIEISRRCLRLSFHEDFTMRFSW
jgi:hypothetical protein